MHSTQSGANHPPLRLVQSSLAPATVARSVSTRSLYAKNDKWADLLASETECPGGERIDRSHAEQARTVACLVNFARSERGLRALTVTSVLNGASSRKARAILRCRRFSHNPCGGDWTATVRAAGYKGTFVENLYFASGRFGAPRPTVDAWLNSVAHRRNLLASNWSEQGLALVVLDRFEGRMNVALWVSVLGDR